jgi:hypothetical protein
MTDVSERIIHLKAAIEEFKNWETPHWYKEAEKLCLAAIEGKIKELTSQSCRR